MSKEQSKEHNENNNDYMKTVRLIFAGRIVMWLTALGFTIHWLYWSFYLYQQEIFEVGQYAAIFRPILYKDLAVSIVCIVISFVLRRISDTIKEVNKSY